MQHPGTIHKVDMLNVYHVFSYQSCREMHLEFTPGNKPLAGASNG